MKTLREEADYLLGAAEMTWNEAQRMGFSQDEYVDALIEAYEQDRDHEDLANNSANWKELLASEIKRQLTA